MASYEIRYGKLPGEKTEPRRMHYPTIFAPSDWAARTELSKVRKKAFYEGRRVWLARVPSGEEVTE